MLSGTARATAGATSGAAAAGAAPTGHWSVTVGVTDARGATATATAGLSPRVAARGPADGGDLAAGDVAGNLRYAEWAWHRPAGGGPADEDG
jgi:hypothetical protein